MTVTITPCRPCGHRGESGGWPGLHHRGQRGRPSAAKQLSYRIRRNQGVRRASYRLERMMTIKLRDYLRLHPNEGVELLSEFGYYTLTKQEIKTQLRKHGAVRSVTGRSRRKSSWNRQNPPSPWRKFSRSSGNLRWSTPTTPLPWRATP